MAKENIPDILQQIVDVKQREVERLKTELPISNLENMIESQNHPLNLAGALMGDLVRIIAEVKKASPVKGVLRNQFDPISLATTYVDNGAAAISVLTNADHFQGSLYHMEAVHKIANPRGIPVLRKEFIFDSYQVYEARAHGADAILLISDILTPESLRNLRELSETLRMQCIVEVHDHEGLRIALDAGAEILGINNRDLHTFKTSLEVTEKLAPFIPSDKIFVSESGITNKHHIQRIKETGAHAVLVGEALVTAPNVADKLKELV